MPNGEPQLVTANPAPVWPPPEFSNAARLLAAEVASARYRLALELICELSAMDAHLIARLALGADYAER